MRLINRAILKTLEAASRVCGFALGCYGQSRLGHAIDRQASGAMTIYRRAIWSRRLRSLGERAEIDATVSIAHPERAIIGADARLDAFVRLDARGGIAIGARATIESGVVLTTLRPAEDRLNMRQNTPGKPIIIEDDAWIGPASTVMPGVKIGRGAVIQPGSVVQWDVPPYAVATGVPARVTAYRPVAGALDETLPSVNLDDIAAPLPEKHQVILEDLGLPPFAKHQNHDDYTPLMRLVHAIRPAIVFEYGTAQGSTVANICANCDARVFTLNALPEQISGEGTTFTLDAETIGRVYRARGYASRVKQILCDSLKFDPAAWLSPSSVDLAIVDACHDTSYVLSDFLKLVDYMRPGGVVLLHDTHPSQEGHLGGSYAACCALRARGFDIRHLEGTWWAYWKKPAPAVAAGPSVTRRDAA